MKISGSPPPDFWDQWRAILWLRWRLSRNQWFRRGGLDRISGIVLAGLGVLAALLAVAAGALVGMSLLANAEPAMLLFAVDGALVFFLFCWVVGMLTEIQRSESLDLSKLLHLPVSLGQVFVFNYAASWVTPSVVIGLPGLLALTAGLAVARGPVMLWLAPVVAGFFFFITAVSYLLRGWLAAQMLNERRRRAIVVGASLIVVVLAQAPNFYFNVMRQRPGLPAGDLPGWFGPAHMLLPPLWVGAGAAALARQSAAPAAGASAGFFVFGALALLAAYRATLRAQRGAVRVPRPRKPRVVRPSRMAEARLPLVPPEAAAVALATLRSHLRAPEVKMALFGQVVMNVIFAFMFLRPGRAASPGIEPALGATIALLALFGAVQILFNQFGFDRDGFRSYVLAPVARANILLGKNLAAFPLVSAAGALVLILAAVFGRVGPLAVAAAGFTLLAGFLLFSVLGNWLSIIAPYRMAAGSLKPTKAPARVTVVVFLGMALSPVAGAVMFLPVLLGLAGRWLGWPGAALLDLAGSVFLAGLAGGFYALMLAPLGRLLEAREKQILAEVTREIE